MTVTAPASLHDLPLGHLDACQICGSREDLELVLDLGFHPPCDSLLRPEQLKEMEATYPLRFLRCRRCGLAQIDHVVPPPVLFHPDYPYRTGITDSLVRGFANTAETVTRQYALPSGSLVIDIGSNDGTLLSAFRAHGMRVLGVEPTNVARIAIANGIPTVQAFFSEQVARRIRADEGAAAAITAANMFAHVPNLGDLIRGVRALLTEDGVFVSESHYLLDLLATVQYDSIYHEHLKYYAMRPMLTLFDQHDFSVVDVERIPNYGGSIRVYAMPGRGRPASERLRSLLDEEKRSGIYAAPAYERFRQRTERSKLDLLELLLRIRRDGQRVVGVGCPGRSSTLLNYCGIGPDLLPYIAEQSSSLKLGSYLPGMHIPVIDEAVMFEEQPEFALMLSWHYAGLIMRNLRQKGLRSAFILPLPEVAVVRDV